MGRFDSNIGTERIRQAAKPLDFDVLFDQLDKAKKSKDAKLKADQDFNASMTNVDLHAKYYGVGNAVWNTQTGQAAIVPPSAPSIPPSVQAAYATGAGMSGQPISSVVPGASVNPVTRGPYFDPNDPSVISGGGSAIPQSTAQLPAILPPTQSSSVSAPPSVVGLAGNSDTASKTNQLIQQIQNDPSIAPIAKQQIIRSIAAKGATAQLAAGTKEETQAMKDKLQTDKTFNSIVGLTQNGWAQLQTAFKQQGGGGPFKGIIGNIASAMGASQTGGIYAYKNVLNDTAIKLGSLFAEGSRGAVTLSKLLRDSVPKNIQTEDQALSAFAEMINTAYVIKSSVDKEGKTPQQIDQMDQQRPGSARIYFNDLISNASAESLENPNVVFEAALDRLKKVKPRPAVVNGEITEPQPWYGADDESRIRSALSSGNYKIISKRNS